MTFIVVGLNEAQLLKTCLSSLGFCDTVLYLDLGSDDDSCQIAFSKGAKVHSVPRSPNVETVIWENQELIESEWVGFIDPDEELSPSLQNKIKDLFKPSGTRIPPSISNISVPWRFFAFEKPLRGTPWGGNKYKAILFRTSDVKFTPEVHKGKIVPPETELRLCGNHDEFLRHNWLNSYSALLEKHRRYLIAENLGKSRTLTHLFLQPINFFTRFVESYILERGFKDGPRGMLLSLLWAWYQSSIITAK